MSAITTAFGKVITPDHITIAEKKLKRNRDLLNCYRHDGPPSDDPGLFRRLEDSTKYYDAERNAWLDQLLEDEILYLDTGETDHLRKYFEWIEIPEWFAKGGVND